ncbi:MAG: YitT family protein [Erysipelotrichaceae bacterium]|nr:YitT family protein [Erysipelotrichaceae bacterium]
MGTFRKKDLKTGLMVVLSALVYSFAIKGFVRAGELFPGGFSGISVLFTRSMSEFFSISIPFGLVYGLLNIGPTLLVYKVVGKRFALFSVLHYVLVSIFTSVFPDIALTGDIFLISVFGGILGGLGVSLALNANASTGGTDFIAIYASSKARVPVWTYIMYANTLVLVLAGYLFGWEKALYSIIYQFCSTYVVSQRHMRFKLKTIHLVTAFPDEVTRSIYASTRHGITRIWGEGGYSHQEKCMLYTVVNAFEVDDVIEAAKSADPRVFISISGAERVIGNYYQKPLE